MRSFKTVISALILFFAIANTALAQNNNQPFSEDFERQMLEMQRRLMDEFRNFARPQWDTTYQYRFDTTFEGGSMSQFFRVLPFGIDTLSRSDFSDFDRMFEEFEQFFNFDGQLTEPDYGIRDFPEDDGAKPAEDDELLPEERLRQQDEPQQKQPGRKGQPAKPAEPKPDPKIKTIRI
jgi:hypothetical protein